MVISYNQKEEKTCSRIVNSVISTAAAAVLTLCKFNTLAGVPTVPPAALPCSVPRCTQGGNNYKRLVRGCEAAEWKYKQFIIKA